MGLDCSNIYSVINLAFTPFPELCLQIVNSYTILKIPPYKTLLSFEFRKRGSALTSGASFICMYLYVSVLVNRERKKKEKYLTYKILRRTPLKVEMCIGRAEKKCKNFIRC